MGVPRRRRGAGFLVILRLTGTSIVGVGIFDGVLEELQGVGSFQQPFNGTLEILAGLGSRASVGAVLLVDGFLDVGQVLQGLLDLLDLLQATLEPGQHGGDLVGLLLHPLAIGDQLVAFLLQLGHFRL